MSADESMAQQALYLAKQNARDIESHEDICAERYAGIHGAINEIKSTIKWAGTTGFAIIISVLGFLLMNQLNTNDKIRDDSASKVEQLQRQLDVERAQRANPPVKEPYVNAPTAN